LTKTDLCSPVVLIIMDGLGCRSEIEGNAVAQAHTPNLKRFQSNYPFVLIRAAGESVGLPAGQMGNSEVGHLNLGAGRIVYQELTRIDKAIESGELWQNEVLQQAMEKVQQNNSALHLLGLLSDGGVHSHISHLFALLKMARNYGFQNNVYIHAVLDGRDVPPQSAIKYLEELKEFCKTYRVGTIASVSGRYYTMDRDNRWERTRKAYDTYVYGAGNVAEDPAESVKEAYRRGENDEFVTPVLIANSGEKPVTIQEEDALIFFNFRPDRMRQIVRTFLEKEIAEIDRGPEPVFPMVVSLTEYDPEYSLPVAYPPQYLRNTLGEWLSLKNCRQFRLAETEKYAHVTFFFNGGKEEPVPGEERCLIPSPSVATYDLQPEMSASEVAERACREISRRYYSFMVINFANADMVGHTGMMKETIRAVEAVDQGVGLIVEKALEEGYYVLITADHGNAEIMIDSETKAPQTAHSNSDVPFFLIDKTFSYTLKGGGILADIAPTVLDLMNLPLPQEMTGKSLLAYRKQKVE